MLLNVIQLPNDQTRHTVICLREVAIKALAKQLTHNSDVASFYVNMHKTDLASLKKRN